MTVAEAIFQIGFFATLMVACLTLTSVAFIRRQGVLAYTACGFWLILGVTARQYSLLEWDAYYGIFFLCSGMVFVCGLEPVIMRAPKEETEREEDDLDKDEDNDQEERSKARRSDRRRRNG